MTTTLPQTDVALDVTPLSAHIGAELRGLDLRSLSDAEVAAIRAAWLCYVHGLTQAQAASHLGQTWDAAIGVLEDGITERTTRLRQFLSARNIALPPLRFPSIACPLQVAPGTPPYDHIAWVKNLSSDQVKLGTDWLQDIVETFVRTNRIP